MRNKLGVFIVVAMVAAACGGGTSDNVTDPPTAADQAVAEDPADHHEGEGDVAEHGHDEDPADRIIEVSLTEFNFDRPDFVVARGETVAFAVTNNGRVEHEFRLTTEHAAHEHMSDHESDHADHAGSDGGHHEEFYVLIRPGATETLTVSFGHDAEFDVAGCLLPGHWEAGLHAPLAIES